MSYLDWKVGDRVVYRPSSVKRTGWHKRLTVGRIYTIRQVVKHPFTGEVGIYLAEVVNDIHPAGMERGYYARSFRRVVPRKTDISVFTAMLNKSKIDA